jgi:putative ABC transport system substrate-binding protein
MLPAFRRGLDQLGFEEGRNLTIEYRFADGEYERVPALVTEVVRRRPSVIVFPGVGSAMPPEASWQELRVSRIPVVFNSATDPVRQGLVATAIGVSIPRQQSTGIDP